MNTIACRPPRSARRFAEQILRLPGREDGRRLVEDQDRRPLGRGPSGSRRAAPRRPTGSSTTASGSDVGTRSSSASSAIRAFAASHVEDRAALLAEDDVLRHGERVDQQEVLVHHPDPERDRGPRTRRSSTSSPRTRIRPVRRRGYIPYRTRISVDLPGAVLADQRVDLARARSEGDVVVREDAGEALRDVLEDDEGRGARRAPPRRRPSSRSPPPVRPRPDPRGTMISRR